MYTSICVPIGQRRHNICPQAGSLVHTFNGIYKTDNNNHISRSKLLILYTQHEPKPMVLIILTPYESSLLSVACLYVYSDTSYRNYIRNVKMSFIMLSIYREGSVQEMDDSLPTAVCRTL
jgi:hypothetical protein